MRVRHAIGASGGLYPVVASSGVNTDSVAYDFVNDTVFIGDPSGPFTGQLIFERLRFAYALIWAALKLV